MLTQPDEAHALDQLAPEHEEELLDEAVEESFPASDPAPAPRFD